MALELLEIVYRANESAVEGVADRNGHIWKVLGKVNSVSWVDARTKGEGREYELTKNVSLNSDLLKFFLKKKHKITEFSLTQICLRLENLRFGEWGKKIESY